MIKVIMLAYYLMSAMISWVPESQHTFYEKSDVTRARYTALALSIAEVALDPNQESLFEGEDGRVQTALLLAAIASHESFFNRATMECRRSGDHGQAWGPWQTHSGKFRTCGSYKAGATIALDMIRTSFEACKNLYILNRLAAYTAGRCISNYESRDMMSRTLDWYNGNKPEFIEIVEDE